MRYGLPERSIEAEIIRSKGKLTGIQFAGTLVLACMLFCMPIVWIIATISALLHHETINTDAPLVSAFEIIGSFLVAAGFAYIGFGLVRRAFQR
jgi:hypothetical protein